MRVDIPATILSLTGGLCTISLHDNVRAIGFSIWFISNLLWLWHGFKIKSLPIVVTFTGYTILNIVGVLINYHVLVIPY